MAMDIIDGIATAVMAFKAEDLQAPSVILLKSHDEGMRFLIAVRNSRNWVATIGDPSLGKPVEMADGSVWMEVKVMDVAIRWPANKFATQDGSWSYA